MIASSLPLLGLAVGVSGAAAEPVFLSRQYTRCTNCHYSPTGGGLLTPYGRSLSREELSTFGASHGAGTPSREQDFLFGALGKGLGPVSVGLELLPAHLSVDSAGYSSSRDFLMNTALAAALQYRKWTFYGQVGRQPRGDETRVTSFEHWVMYQSDAGVGARVGRFLPAYGVQLADHTAFTRATLGFDNNDQIYGAGAELQERPPPGAGGRGSRPCRVPRERPGAGRLHRHRALAVRPAPAHGAGGVGGFPRRSDTVPEAAPPGLALGFAPHSRLTLWTEADVRLPRGLAGRALLQPPRPGRLRGVPGRSRLELSPQLLTQLGDASAGVFRINVGLNLLPRTHWNVVVSFYNDHDRTNGYSARRCWPSSTSTELAHREGAGRLGGGDRRPWPPSPDAPS